MMSTLLRMSRRHDRVSRVQCRLCHHFSYSVSYFAHVMIVSGKVFLLFFFSLFIMFGLLTTSATWHSSSFSNWGATHSCFHYHRRKRIIQRGCLDAATVCTRYFWHQWYAATCKEIGPHAYVYHCISVAYLLYLWFLVKSWGQPYA